MKTNTTFLLTLCTLGMIGLGVVTASTLPASVGSECVGKPYGTPGCPLKTSSSSSKPLTCGNGVLEAGEECDLGNTRNGFSNCTKNCVLLYCGDSLISPALKEECEPESEEIYALDPVTGELVIEVRYLSPTCGAICTVPSCGQDGNCSGGCKTSFLPACTNSSSNGQTAFAVTSSSPLHGAAPSLPASGTAVSAAYVPRCGNGLIDSGEQCDDGNSVNIDACTNICRISLCNDKIVQIWEQCDDGNLVDADACSNTCKSPACGDGVVQTGEECDDANQLSSNACTNACKVARCGDQVIQQNEECDDGNQINSDFCTNACRSPRCGDAIAQTGEECDDGNTVDTDMCTSKCANARCGDNILQQNEECDDGNRVNADSCNNLCKLPACGNAVREGEEVCDDGNQSNNDSCTNTCQRPSCGDGYLQPGEYCDDGNQDNEDNCTTTCRVPVCGDGLLHPREECDNGRSNSDTKPDSCRKDCRSARCGDGLKDEGEECDGGIECSVECKVLKAAAPVDVSWDIPGFAWGAIGLAGLGSAAMLAFVFRKNLHSLIARTAGESAAQALDDIPLDQIEMPWHKW